MKDKVVIITGGSRGIGKAAVELFANKGAIVYIWDLVDGAELANSINLKGGKAYFSKVSVTDVSAIEAAVSNIIAKYQKIDVLINNAGVTKDKSFLKMTHEEWQSVIDINLTGIFNCTKAVVPYMVEAKAGRIICTSSIVGLTGNFGQSNYVATKAAILGLVKTWAKEFGKHNITANAVAPGFIKSDMTDLMPSDVIEKVVADIPVKRMGLPSDIANAYLFLASDEASFINGHCISVNGGAF